MMLLIWVTNEKQDDRFEHDSGPIEFGRAVRPGTKRHIIQDICVSRDQLRLEELLDGRLRVENLSQTRMITVADDNTTIPTGTSQDLTPPVNLVVGETHIYIGAFSEGRGFHAECLQPIAAPVRSSGVYQLIPLLEPLATASSPDQLARWMETVIALFRSSNSPDEIYSKTAEAIVRLVGLDLGLVLLRDDDDWQVAASYRGDPGTEIAYSRGLVQYVAEQRRTFYEDIGLLDQRSSLRAIQAAVVSPVFGLNDEVSGMLYATRSKSGFASGRMVGLLEAQLVQLLAAAIGLNLTRAVAARTRMQFEQFFSPELVRELERNPKLLEGRSQEVTLLFSDLRGFTSMSERLGAETTFRVVRDLMEHLSRQIIAQDGVIVDYAGDGIFAMWNAPVEQEDHASRACRAALAMIKGLPKTNDKWREILERPLSIGIGIHTGTALVGNTGTTCKFKYGPSGFTVCLTSRVQDATKKLGGPVLITASTQRLLPSSFITSASGPVQLPGVAEDLPLHELHGECVTDAP